MTTFLALCGYMVFAWVSIAIAGAYFTDWRELSKTYRTGTTPKTELRGQVVGMGWEWAAPDLLKIRMTAAKEGLYLSVHPLYEVIRPPLLIPWKDFCAVLQKGTGPSSCFKLLLPTSSNILVTSKAYQEIHPFLTHLSHAPLPTLARDAFSSSFQE